MTLTLLLPYHPFDRPIPVPKGYDSTFYPPGMENVPKKYAIVRANRYMVDHSDLVVAYLRYAGGGTYYTVKYAVERGKEILYLK